MTFIARHLALVMRKSLLWKIPKSLKIYIIFQKEFFEKNLHDNYFTQLLVWTGYFVHVKIEGQNFGRFIQN